MKLNRVMKIIVLVLVIGPLAILAFGGVVMLLWNNVAVPVLHLSEITFWQALGLLVLCKILFGHFGDKSGSNRYYKKQQIMWKHMTPEQKERFREEWHQRRRWWRSRPSSEPGADQANTESL